MQHGSRSQGPIEIPGREFVGRREQDPITEDRHAPESRHLRIALHSRIQGRGENIAAWSIERVINQHEKVLESAAYGVKSEEYAEDEVMAAVVLKPGETLTPEELVDFCQDKMADFMIPRFIDFVEKLPKSEVHRIMKRFLKDRGVTETTYDREKAG